MSANCTTIDRVTERDEQIFDHAWDTMTLSHVAFPWAHLEIGAVTFRTFQHGCLRTGIINGRRDGDMVLRIIRGQDTNVRRARLHGELSQVSTAKTQRLSESGLLLLQV